MVIHALAVLLLGRSTVAAAFKTVLKADEFETLDGSQCVPFPPFDDLECPPSTIEGTEGSVTVTLLPESSMDMPWPDVKLAGVEGPYGPTLLRIEFDMANLDPRCNTEHDHRRKLANHDSGSNSTAMECGFAIHEWEGCHKIWGKISGICGPARQADADGVAPPEMIDKLCPADSVSGRRGVLDPQAFRSWDVLAKYTADADGNAVGSVDLFAGWFQDDGLGSWSDGLLNPHTLEKPLVFYDHDGVQIACAELRAVASDEDVAEEGEGPEVVHYEGDTHDEDEDEVVHSEGDGHDHEAEGVHFPGDGHDDHDEVEAEEDDTSSSPFISSILALFAGLGINLVIN